LLTKESANQCKSTQTEVWALNPAAVKAKGLMQVRCLS